MREDSSAVCAVFDSTVRSAQIIWGLGGHLIGFNFFWYLRDPVGNFSESFSDMDSITDDQMQKPDMWEREPSLRAVYAWRPGASPSMLAPDDLADLKATSRQG